MNAEIKEEFNEDDSDSEYEDEKHIDECSVCHVTKEVGGWIGSDEMEDEAVCVDCWSPVRTNIAHALPQHS